MLGAWGIPEDSPEGRQRLERAVEDRRAVEKGVEEKGSKKRGQKGVKKGSVLDIDI